MIVKKNAAPAKAMGSALTRKAFTHELMLWGPSNGRSGLPWQVKDPYAVWISEIMLQQTQVETAKPDFTKFLTLWPDVKKLAAAQEDDIMAAWAGLGYYRRAKFLHQAAKDVVGNWGGALPKSSIELAALPGIGRSTAAAIASIAHGERVAIMDGNVVRVLARYFGCESDVLSSATQKQMWATAESLVDPAEPGRYTQYIMDLGATICSPKSPKCAVCPMASRCIALKKNIQTSLPHKIKFKKERRVESEVWRIFYDGGKVALCKNLKKTGVWQSMHVFAMDGAQIQRISRENVSKWSFRHVFSHYDLNVDVVLDRISCEDFAEACDRNEGWFGVSLDEALALSVPTPVKDVVQRIKREEKL